MRTWFLTLVAVLLLCANGASAACVLPDGVGGDLVFNSDHSVMQYCNGNDWIGLGGPILDPRISTLTPGKWCAANLTGSSIDCTADAPGGGADTLADLSCSTNEIPKWNGTAWACDADGGVPASSDGHVQFNNAGAFGGDANFFWDNTNKRLGIGISTPESGVQVSSGATGFGTPSVDGVFINHADSYAKIELAGSTGSLIDFTTAGTDTKGRIIYTNATNTLSFATNATANRVVIDGTGNVGIGTTAPNVPLLVNGLTGVGDSTHRLYIGGTGGMQGTTDRGGWIAFDNGGSGTLGIQGEHGGTGYKNLALNPNGGNVGIGTTTPASLLQVAGGIQLGNDAATCPGASNVKVGTLRYSSDSLDLCGIGGWVSLGSGALVTGTAAAGTLAAAVTNAGWQNFPGSPTMSLPSAGIYYVTSQNYYAHSAGCGDVIMNWSGSNITYQSSDAKWQACGASGTNNWTTDGHVLVVSAATTLNAQYTWTNAGTSGQVRFNGAKFVKLNSGGGGGGSASAAGANGQIQINGGSSTFAADAALHWDNTNKRLGIGLAAPASPLHVHAAGSDVRLYLTNGSTGATATDGAWLQVDSSRDLTIMNRENAHLMFATNNNTRLTVRNDGNVGIGTTAPTSNLTISANAAALPGPQAGTMLHIGTADATNGIVTLDAYGSTTNLNFRASGGTAAAPTATVTAAGLGNIVWQGRGATSYITGSAAKINAVAEENWSDTTGATALLFSTRPAGSTGASEERLRITSSGNVGIGTATPGSKLTVAGDIYTSGNALVGNVAPTLYLLDSDHRSAMIHNNSNQLYVLRGAGNGSTSWTTYNGYWPLQINLENNDAVLGGNVYAFGYFHNSDARLKKDIETIPNALSLVGKLRGVSYRWKHDDAAALGVIAQDVEKVVPSAVKTNSKGDKTVEYDQLIGPLIEAVKELKADNDNLRAKLEAANDNLRDRIEQLENAGAVQ